MFGRTQEGKEERGKGRGSLEGRKEERESRGKDGRVWKEARVGDGRKERVEKRMARTDQN